MNIRQATAADYPQILQLQHANTPEQLTAEQKRQGFIVSKMNESQLDAINHGLGILVADDAGRIAGFVCLHSVADSLPRPAVVDSMLAQLPQALLAGRRLSDLRVFLYGPVCLANDYRGQGLLRQLFVAVRQRTAADFDAGVAFVNDSNPHSLAAHVHGLGMQDALCFCHDGETFHLLAFASSSTGE